MRAGFLFAVFGMVIAPVSASAAPGDTCSEPVKDLLISERILDLAASVAKKGDVAMLDHLMPMLERQLAALPAVPTISAICFGKHYVFDRHEFTALTAGRNAAATAPGAPALPIAYSKVVGQVAYLVGWRRFEKHDFAGAVDADRKGLALIPLDHELTRELLSALFQAKGFDEAKPLLAATLADSDLTSRERVQYLDNLTTAEVATRDYAAARVSNARALALDASDDLAVKFARALKDK